MVQRPVIERRRYDADINDVGAGLCEAVHQRVAKLGATRPIVTTDRDGSDAVSFASLMLTQICRVRAADRASGFGCQIAADDATNIVLSENARSDGHASDRVCYLISDDGRAGRTRRRVAIEERPPDERRWWATREHTPCLPSAATRAAVGQPTSGARRNRVRCRARAAVSRWRRARDASTRPTAAATRCPPHGVA